MKQGAPRSRTDRGLAASIDRVLAQGGLAIRGDVVLDTAGFIVSQQLGPPLNGTFTRRAK